MTTHGTSSRIAGWAAVVVLAAATASAGDTYLLAGTGLGGLRHAPRAVYGSLEVVHPLGRSPWGVWGSADLSSADQFVGAGLFAAGSLSDRWAVGLSSGSG